MKPGKPLKRSAPLTAHTGLSRTSGLSRVAPTQRHAPLPRVSTPAKPAKTRERRSGADPDVLTWAAVRTIALERDGWRCVGCGSHGPLDVHHRAFKGSGGSKLRDHLANALTLCGPGNAFGCHGFAHRWKNTRAAALGLSVPLGSDPYTLPVLYPDGGWWLLDDLGGLTNVS